jgi:hypothetical protein
MTGKDERSSLLGHAVSYKETEFYMIGPWTSYFTLCLKLSDHELK